MIKQGVKFEYTLKTFQELNNTLDTSINKISKAEQTKKIDIIQALVAEAPHFFNDDFFGSNFGNDFMDIDKLRQQMIARQKKFLEKYQSEFIKPEDEN